MGDEVYSWYEHTLDITPCTSLVMYVRHLLSCSDCVLVKNAQRGKGVVSKLRWEQTCELHNSHTSNCRHSREDILWYVGEVIVVQKETSQSRDAGEHVRSQKCQTIATQVPAMEPRQCKLPHKLMQHTYVHTLDSAFQCTYVFTQKSPPIATALHTHRHTWSSQKGQKATSFKGLLFDAGNWVVIEVPVTPSKSQMCLCDMDCTKQKGNSQAS